MVPSEVFESLCYNTAMLMCEKSEKDVREKKGCAHGSRLKQYKACVTSVAVKGGKKMSKSLFILEAQDTNRRKFGTCAKIGEPSRLRN